jgi:hypothetical protein
VITNFFHGCVFALLNGKPWASAPSDYRSIKIPDLATMLGSQARIIDEDTETGRFDRLLEMPPQPDVLARIEEARARSNAFLDAALS